MGSFTLYKPTNASAPYSTYKEISWLWDLSKICIAPSPSILEFNVLLQGIGLTKDIKLAFRTSFVEFEVKLFRRLRLVPAAMISL